MNKLLCLVFAVSLFGYLQGPTSVIIVIVGIGFLIFIHELGHFVVAKYEKVRVEAFALGFGPALWKKKYGETEYRLNILPLGGYVKMAGEVPGEGTTGAPDEFTSKTPGARARVLVAGVLMNFLFGILGAIIAFQFGIRFIAPKAGYVVNGSPAWQAGLQKGDEILAIDGSDITNFREIIMAVAGSDEGQSLNIKVRRGEQVLECKVLPQYDETRGFPTIGIGPSTIAQMQIDKETWQIVKVGDRDVESGYDISGLFPQTNTPVQATVKRGSELRTVTLQPEVQKIPRLGIAPRQLMVDSLRQDSAASQAGFREGDIVVSVNGQFVADLAQLTKQPPLTITVRRAGKLLEISVAQDKGELWQHATWAPDFYITELVKDSPAAKELKPGDLLLAAGGKKLREWSDLVGVVQKSAGKPLSLTYERAGQSVDITITPQEYEQVVWGKNIELANQMTEPQRYNILKSCQLGLIHAKQMVMEIFLTLKGLFSKRISSKNLGGPITIFSASYTFLQFGVGDFIYFLALISINLAVLNLLPIPILDGGHLVFVTIEKLRGKPVSEKVIGVVNYIGFILLITLMLYVTYNDILRLVK
jgi:regulator of sigma E protease